MKLKFFLFEKKRLLAAIGGIIIALIVIVAVIGYLKRLQEPVVPAEKVIPPDIAWYIRFNNVQDLLKSICSENDIFTELRNLDPLANTFSVLDQMDSILNSDEDVKELLFGKPVFVCCRYDKDQQPQYFLLMNLPDTRSYEKVDDILHRHSDKGYQFEEYKKGDLSIENCSKAGCPAFSYSIYKGVLIASSSGTLIETVISHIKDSFSIENDKDFIKIRSTTGKNVDGNFYINIHSLKYLLKNVIDSNYRGAIEHLSATASWAGLDLTLKKDEIHMNGYFSVSANDYFSIFKGKQSQRIELTRILPFNTAVMLFLGTENFSEYFDKYRLFRKLNGPADHSSVHQMPDKRCNGDIKDNILSWLGKEMALVITESKNGDLGQNTFAVLRMADSSAAREKLMGISVDADSRDERRSNENELTTRKLLCNGLLSNGFGKVFANLQETFYVVIGDYVVFGSSPQALHMFVSAYYSGKTLEKNENYTAFADHVSNHASFCLYVNIRKSTEMLKGFANSSIRKLIGTYFSRLRNFEAFAIQIAPSQDVFYTSIYLKFNPKYKDENPAVWETKLDTTVSGKPYLITDQNDSSKKIIVFDCLNQMYLLDALGRIQWKIVLKEPPVSNVFSIDRYHNHKSQIVFNTKHQIFMMGLDGSNAQGFPMALAYPATNGLTVADYDNTKEYRLLLVCDDHKLYNFKVDGKRNPDWPYPLIRVLIKEPITHIKMRGRDYLIATDENGNCHFFDRSGNVTFSLKGVKFIKAEHSKYYVYDDGNRSRIITTDRRGRIIRISPDGTWDAVTLNEFSPDHQFLYADFDGNSSKDYLFADSSMIIVYNVNKRIIFKQKLSGHASSAAFQISSSSKKPIFGIVSESSGQICIFSQDGQSPVSQYLFGKTPFCSGQLDHGGVPSLIVGQGKTVYNYLLTGL